MPKIERSLHLPFREPCQFLFTFFTLKIVKSDLLQRQIRCRANKCNRHSVFHSKFSPQNAMSAQNLAESCLESLPGGLPDYAYATSDMLDGTPGMQLFKHP